ncbi:MAG: DUF1573 domain-containing protein [Patescibacteria group bacterium]|nr:DUF1573 domain-containing protein [Patescibacteria group bacterium]
MFKVTEHDFGNVARDAKAEFAFELENLYLEDVHIAHVSSTCGCTTPRIEKDLLKTYEKGAIIAHINTDRFLGRKGATLTVTFDKPFYAQVQLRVSTYIRNDVVFEPGSVQFGSIDQGKPAEARVRVQYIGHSNWKIVDVKNANPHLAVKVLEGGRQGGRVWYDLAVEMNPNSPPGYIHDHLLLKTNDPNRGEVPLLVEGCVVSGVVVSPASLFMGVVEPGQEVTKQLVVRGQQPFRILSIQCGDESFRFDTSGTDAPKSLHLVPVTFTAGGERGKISRTIRIVTDQGTMTMPQLPAYAVVSQETTR